MFKWFTWAKVGGWAVIVGSLLASPLIGGVFGAALAAKLAAIGAALVGIGTSVTTTQAGKATDASGGTVASGFATTASGAAAPGPKS